MGLLTLALLMLRIWADNPHNPFTPDNFALVTDFFYRASNFHFGICLATYYL